MIARLLADRAREFWHRSFRSPGETARLLASSDPTLRNIAAALTAVWRDEGSPEERAWFGRIEAVRQRLLDSQQEVTFTDFGAGAGDLALSEDTMRRGREVRFTVGQICRTAAKPKAWARLLFFLVRKHKPENCLELGTSLGISAAYQSAALELNGAGRLLTLEGAESVAALARQNLESLGLRRATVRVGRFQDILDAVLGELGRVEYAFIDGHHDEQATVTYFENVLPFLSERAVVVFDDIAWSAGMRRAWQRIVGHESVRSAVDLFRMGIAVVGPVSVEKQQFKIAFA